MSNNIPESGMKFISENTYHIEKSQLYELVRSDGVQTVEFIRAIDDKLLFVEAKTTFANPYNPSPGNLEKFQKEIEDICEKFIHSLYLFSAVKTGATEFVFPDDFTLPDKVSLTLILVIKKHESGWCRAPEQALKDALPPCFVKIWKPAVHVINEEIAVEEGIAAFSA